MNDYKTTEDDVKILPVFSETMTFRGVNPFYYLDLIFRFTNLYQLSRKWHQHIEGKVEPIIESKRREMESGRIEFNGSRRFFIYDMLKSDLPKEAVVDNSKLIIPSVSFKSSQKNYTKQFYKIKIH